MDRSNIDKITQNQEDRILLAKLWDKINAGINRNILASTGFLSPREQEMARYLFGDAQGLTAFGGYEDAERKMLVYLPEYLDEDTLYGEDSPIVCLRADFYEGDSPTHRDFLGALMGAGVGRETVGDICIGNGSCDFLVTAQIAAFIEQELSSAGRIKLRIHRVPLAQIQVPTAEMKLIKDTVASLRLDSILASGFRISRALASQYISAGKVAVDGLPSEKPDKLLEAGMKISLRGSGKICLTKVNGQTRKGRISVEIHRYM